MSLLLYLAIGVAVVGIWLLTILVIAAIMQGATWITVACQQSRTQTIMQMCQSGWSLVERGRQSEGENDV